MGFLKKTKKEKKNTVAHSETLDNDIITPNDDSSSKETISSTDEHLDSSVSTDTCSDTDITCDEIPSENNVDSSSQDVSIEESATSDSPSNDSDSDKNSKKKHKKLSKKQKKLIIISTLVTTLLVAIILVSILVPLSKRKGKLFVSKPEDFDNLKNKQFNTFVLEKDIVINSQSPAFIKYMTEGKQILFNGHTLTIKEGDFVYGNESMSSVVLGDEKEKIAKLFVNNGKISILGINIKIYASITNDTKATDLPESNILLSGDSVNVYSSITSVNNQVTFSSKSTLENNSSLISDKISASKGILITGGKFTAKDFFGEKQKVILDTADPTFPAILEKIGENTTSTSSIILKNGSILIMNGKDHKVDLIEGIGDKNLVDGKKGTVNKIVNISKVLVHDESFSVSELLNSHFINVSKITAPLYIENSVSFENNNKIYLTFSPDSHISFIKIINLKEDKENVYPIVSLDDLKNIDISSLIVSPTDISLKIIFYPKEDLIYKDYNSISTSKTYFEESNPVFYKFSPKITLTAPITDFSGIKEVDKIDDLSFKVDKVNFATKYELYINSKKADSFDDSSFEGNTKTISLADYKNIMNVPGKYVIYLIAKNPAQNIQSSQRGSFAEIILKGRYDLSAWKETAPTYTVTAPGSSLEADPKLYTHVLKFKEIKDSSIYKISYIVNGTYKECFISQSANLKENGEFTITLKDSFLGSDFKISLLGNGRFFESDAVNIVLE